MTGMLKHGYTFDLYYEEGGCCFIGHTEGDGESHIDRYWETYTDDDPSKYIPHDVLDARGLRATGTIGSVSKQRKKNQKQPPNIMQKC